MDRLTLGINNMNEQSLSALPGITIPFESSINLNYLMITLERIRYHAALAITVSWKGTNLTRMYDELDWEFLTDRRWCRRLFLLYKIQNNLTPYLKDLIPPIRSHLLGNRSVNVINEIRCKSKSYCNSFYPDSIRCWNKIGPELRKSPNLKSLSCNHSQKKRIFLLSCGLESIQTNIQSNIEIGGREPK